MKDFRDVSKSGKLKKMSIDINGETLIVKQFVTIYPCTAITIYKNNIPLSANKTMELILKHGFNTVFEFRNFYKI